MISVYSQIRRLIPLEQQVKGEMIKAIFASDRNAEQISFQIGVSVRTLSKWLLTDFDLSLRHVSDLSFFLDVPVDFRMIDMT